MNSHRKILHSFLVFVISTLVFAFLIDLSCSLILNKYLNNLKINTKAKLGVDLSFRYAYFEVFSGVLINGIAAEHDNNKLFSARKINLNLDILNTVIKRRIIFQKISLDSVNIYNAGYLQKDFLSLLLANIKNSKDALKSTMFNLSDLNVMGKVALDLDGYIATVDKKLFLTRGKIKLREVEFLNKSKAGFKSGILDRSLNYTFEASYLDNNFIINKLDLTSHSARFLLSGKIKDFSDSVDLELEGELNNFLLEDLAAINNDFLRTNGIFNAVIFISGPINKPVFNSELEISNCSINIFDVLNISKINSKLTCDNQGLNSQQITCQLGDAPINLNFKIDNSEGYNKVILGLVSTNLGVFGKVGINFAGHFLGNILKGDIGVIFDFKNNQKDFNIKTDFKDVKLNIKDFSFNSGSLVILLNEFNNPAKSIYLSQLSGDLTLRQNNLAINNLRAEAYNGLLKGDVLLGVKDGIFSYNSKIFLEKLEVKDITKEFFYINYQLSGLLSGKIIVNSDSNEIISGDLRLGNGDIENNAVLTAVSDFFGIPSLKAISFSSLEVRFHKIWDKYEAQMNLFSPDAQIYLDNKFLPDETMDGYLLVKLTTALMDESNRFRKLFKYIEYKEPTVYFPFKLKGYVNKPRIEWLQNEFKEKLQDFLSDSNKKLLQDGLNKVVEEFVQ